MDLTRPISSVIPSAYGPVLQALVGAGMPMSSRQLATLVHGSVGRSRVNTILGELTASGIVRCTSHPPSLLYELNRDHVAAPYIEGLANLRSTLLHRMRSEAQGWAVPAVAVWLFGSAARGDGAVDSDIDVLILRADDVDLDDAQWCSQVDDWSHVVRLWSGNTCSVLEMSLSEFFEAVETKQRIVNELKHDAVGIAGISPMQLLSPTRPEETS